MAEGVTFIDPTQAWIGPDATIGRDTVVWPQTHLIGHVTVGEECQLGPNSRLTDTTVGSGCIIDETIAIEAVIENGVIAEQGTVLEVFTNPQKPITKDFISVLLSNELPAAFRGGEVSKTPLPGAYLLLRLTFIGESADDPVLAGMIRKFPEIEVTMLFGNLDQIKSTPFGRMIIGITGPEAKIQEALQYLRQQDLKEEVIGYVRRHDSTSD